MSSESEFDFLENISSSDDYKPSISDSDSDNAKKISPTKRKATPKRNTRASSTKKAATRRKTTKRKKPEPECTTTLPDLGRLAQVKMKDGSSTIQLEHAFELLDKEEKGFVSIDDLRRVLKGIGETISEEELQEMIEEADTSNSGHVTREDFLNFMINEQDTTLER